MDKFMIEGTKRIYGEVEGWTAPRLGNSDLYNDVCGKDQFRIVDNNIRLLVKKKKYLNSNYPHINVKLSINRISYRYIIEMWRYAKSIEVDNVFARCMNNFEENQDVELTLAQKKNYLI